MQGLCLSNCRLPIELWRKVFRFATQEDGVDDGLLFHPEVTPSHVLETKLAVTQVCHLWKDIADEYLWESVGNTDQRQLILLAELLVKEQRSAIWRNGNRCRRGWWIRGLHTRFNFGECLDTFIHSIVSILQCCPNLHTFMHIHDFNGPLPTRVITALANHCGSTLHSFQLDWGGVNIDDLLLLLETSPALQHLAVGCTFAPPSFNSVASRQLRFHRLRSLHFGNSEDGMTRRYNCHLLEAATWHIPALSTVSIDLDARTAVDELFGFLQTHGPKLNSLSLTESGRIDGMPVRWNDIFTLCPKLKELRVSHSPFSHPNLPTRHFIESKTAAHLERLCFAQWEFFPGVDKDLLHPDLPMVASLKRALDSQFEPIGSDLTPSLKVVQFDFHAGKLDLPESFTSWWDEWLIKWHGKGISIEGCQRKPLGIPGLI